MGVPMEASEDCFKWVKIYREESVKYQEVYVEGDQIDILLRLKLRPVQIPLA